MSSKNTYDSLTDYQKHYRRLAQELVPSTAPSPWKVVAEVGVSSLLGVGWVNDELVAISLEGYSIISSEKGEVELFVNDYKRVLRNLKESNQKFFVPQRKTTITVFGVFGGDGISSTDDGWVVDIIYPWWPEPLVVMQHDGDNDNLYALDISVSSEWVKCGFSPSGSYFVVADASNIFIYTRLD